MDRIKKTDDRDTAIKKFDSCMDDFFILSKRYMEEVKRIGNSEENKVKISTLSMNYYHDTFFIAEIVLAYYPYISRSMLDVRYDKHNEYYNRLQAELIELKLFVARVVNAGAIGLENTSCETTSIMKIDSSLMSLDKSITTQLKEEGNLYFEGIASNLQTIEEKINELRLIHQTRGDSDYEMIYDWTREQYFNSEIWEEIKDGYINYLNEFIYKDGVTISQIDQELSACHRALMEDREIGTLWLARHDKKTQLSQSLVAKNYDTSEQIDYLFSILGKIELLQNWKGELNFEMLPVQIAEEKKDLSRSVIFIGEWNEERFMQAWPEIYSYLNQEKDAAYDWCCLHHTLTFYHIIERTTFAIFMRWLKKMTGEDLISETNIRQVSSYYFVDTVETQWTLKDMEKYYEGGGKQKITTHLGNKYRKYSGICINLREIIKSH